MQALKCFILLIILVVGLIPLAFVTFIIKKMIQLVLTTVETIEDEVLEPICSFIEFEADKLK